MRAIGVQFESPSKVHYYDAGKYDVQKGDWVVVKTKNGHCLAKVSMAEDELEKKSSFRNLPRIERPANDNDHRQLDRNRRKEVDAFTICQKKVREMKLPMKLVKAQFTLGGGKVTFFFYSEDRVDFRHLVKNLNVELGMKIEMVQIGVRDAAGMIGGIGICGREYCCATFLTSFKPVSIKMAKVQNLSLNPEKVSGGCGRLRCCLTYEMDVYHELNKGLPKVGKRVNTVHGEGKVKSVEVLKRIFTVDLGEEKGDMTLRPEDVIRRDPRDRQPQNNKKKYD